MISPAEVQPVPGQYISCTEYVGTVADGATINVTCDRPEMVGRYIIIQIHGHSEILTLCEVEVYGGSSFKYNNKKNWYFTAQGTDNRVYTFLFIEQFM